MLSVKVNNRKVVYVTFTEDTKPNEGGFYCEIYEDNDCRFKIDAFTIRKEKMRSEDKKERQKEAMIYANKFVKDYFNRKV